jgi:glycosyltransferase involved in cell wall biosynthesis
MKIGIVPVLDKNGGGSFQYSNAVLQGLLALKQNGYPDDFIILSQSIYDPYLEIYKRNGFQIESLEYLSPKQKVKQVIKRLSLDKFYIKHLSSFSFGKKSSKKNLEEMKHRSDLYQRIRSLGVQLILYLSPNSLSFEIGIPYIFPVHDLQHRIHPEFLEVSADGEYEEREYLYTNGIKNATMILTDSIVGKEDILHYYGKAYTVNPGKIQIFPYTSSFNDNDVVKADAAKVKKQFHIASRYLFYPAQFWPHKNHIRIIKALAGIKKNKNINIPIIFCGSVIGKYKKEVLSQVKKIASQNNLNVEYLGYVNTNQLIGLYKNATALLMPTFFGPTNIPIIEAWMTDCPIITSNIRGIRQQVGNAALLVDPSSIEDIAEKTLTLWNDEKFRKKLIENGRKKIKIYNFKYYCAQLVHILETAKRLVSE